MVMVKNFIGYKTSMRIEVNTGGVVRKINFVSPIGETYNPWLLHRAGTGVFSDISIIGGDENCSVINVAESAENFIRVVIDTGGVLHSTQGGVSMPRVYLLRGSIGGGAARYVDLRSTSDKYNPLNYQSFPLGLLVN